MDIFSLIVSGLLAAGMAYFIIMMVFRIRNNVVTGYRFRDALTEELNRLRLSRMLQALGFNIDQYTHTQNVVDIQRQMKNCASCANISTCDEKLEKGEVDPDYMDYCANADDLQRMKTGTD